MVLSSIRALAMDFCDRQDNPTTGKFSTAWWTRQINYAKDVLAQETGYYRTWQPLSVVANIREYDNPSTLCWGIQEARYEGQGLTPVDVYQLMEDSGSRFDGATSSPTTYAIKGNQIELNPAPKRSVTSGGAIISATAGGNFANQPTNDAIEIVSDSASDTTQTLTVWGTTFQTGDVCEESIVLNGTTAVSSVKTDWGDILGMELDAACAGTVTIREASANQTIITITAGNTSKGVATPTNTDGGKAYPLVMASSTSTAVVGLYGTNSDGTTEYDNCINLTGTASLTRKFPKRMDMITKILVGAVATGNNVTVTRGAALEIYGGTLPTDFSGESDAATGLPAQFHIYLAHGAAAMAEVADLYEAQMQGRATVHSQAFWKGVEAIRAYYSSMQMEKADGLGRDNAFQNMYDMS